MSIDWRPATPEHAGVAPPDAAYARLITAGPIAPLTVAVIVDSRRPGTPGAWRSVFAHTRDASLVIIDDATSDSWSAVVSEHDGVRLIRHPQARGYGGCAAEAATQAGRGDLVLLDGDVEVGPGWLDGLRRVAAGSAGVGLVAADVHGRAADFPGCEHLGAAEIARAVGRAGGPVGVEVAEVGRGAVLITQAALDAWRSAAEPALSLAQVARLSAMHGLRTVVACRVAALRTEAMTGPAPTVPGRVGLPDRAAVAAALRAQSVVLPRRLYLPGPTHGAGAALQRIAAGLTHVQESYLLECAGNGATLSLLGPAGPEIVTRHTGPLDAVTLLALLVDLDLDLVHADNAAPAAGLLLEVAARLGVPRVASISTLPVDPHLNADLLLAPGPDAAAATADLPVQILDPGSEVPVARALRQRRARRGGPTRVLAWPADSAEVVHRLRALAERTGPAVEFHTLGAVDLDLDELLIVHRAGESAVHRVLNEIDPDLGLVLDDAAEARSAAARVWWALGVPLLVLGEGEAAARVREFGAGVALPGDDLDTAAAVLRELALYPDRVQRLRTEVPRRAVVPTGMAVERYRACYTEVSHRPARRPRVGYVMRGEQGRHDSCEQIRILARLAQLEPGAAVVRQVLPAEARNHDVLRGLDVLLVQQRMLEADAEPVLAAVRATGTRLVVDIDDDLIDPEAQPRSNLDPRDFMRLGVELATRLRSADTVLVSTESLAERLGPLCGARCVLVPNHLNPRIWTIAAQTRTAPRHRGFRLLYMGTRTHLEDLQLLQPVLDEVASNLSVPVTLEVVGVADAFDGDEWITRLPIPKDARNYPQFVAWLRSNQGRWDAAVAPLVDSRFNQAKSDLKLLEYALLDLPVVASDAGPYRGAEHLARLTDNDPAAWVAALSEILGDRPTATLRAESAREFVLSRRMITAAHTREWLATVLGTMPAVEHDGSRRDGPLLSDSDATTADAVRYADGAEDEVLARLRAAADTSAGSDELAAQAGGSWELAYHLSPRRFGLLAPLRLHAGMRVADLGCGSGVLSRAMGESGASVLGVEGVRSRAAAARQRCADLPNVQIVDGRAEEGLAGVRDLDLVLVCGLLEYTAKDDPAGPARLLRAISEALAPDGVLVVAIENQLGLGYLVGRHEDHHDTPWVGMADYPLNRSGPRTWTTRRLTSMFAEHGLTATRWFASYPDYKVPRVLLDAELFDRPDAVELVDKLVRHPLDGAFRGSEAVVSGRRFQRILIEEGMGLSTAPCFLVVCARTPEAIAARTEDELAWMTTNSRLTKFRRARSLGRDGQLHTRGEAHTHTTDWLTQRQDEHAPLVPGRPMDALLLDALHDGDQTELHRLLRMWHDAAAVGEEPAPDDAEPHPFLPRPGVAMWQPDRLDAHPGNWILTPDGTLVAVDDEWRARTGVDAELAALRALFLLAIDVVSTGAAHPWGTELTIRQILSHLVEPLGLGRVAAARWDEMIAAEAHFQHLVTDVDMDGWIAHIGHRADESPKPWLWDITGGLAVGEAQLAAAVTQSQSLRGQVAWERSARRRVERKLVKAEGSLAAARARADRVEKRLTHSRARVSQLESSTPIQLGKALRTPARAVRAARRRAGRLKRRALALRRKLGG